MLERDGYPPGVPCWIDTAQPDPEAATAFYGALFGWEFDDRMAPDSGAHYFVARLDGADVGAVGSQTDVDPARPEWSTYIAVEGADESASKVRAAGGKVLAEPFDVFDAGRMALCSDPNGATFCLWEAKAHKGAALVNVPGTWNFSDLPDRRPRWRPGVLRHGLRVGVRHLRVRRECHARSPPWIR